MNRKLLWIWLTQRAAMTHERISHICDYFDDIESLYNAGYNDYIKIDSIMKASVVSLCDKSLAAAQKVLQDCEKYGIGVMTCEDDIFPKRISGLPSPAHVLYYRGTLPDWDNIFGVAMVGTRRCSDYGMVVAQRFSIQMAAKGITVISGMASGIDSYSLIGALNGGANVIAVMGCGLEKAYPQENEALMQRIIKNGCAISEYPPGALPLKKHFPERNRLVCGLADAVVAVEAPKRSGTLITTSLAMDYGRKVFAVPGSILYSNSVGTNNLLKIGAIPMTCVNDLIDEFAFKMKALEAVKKESDMVDEVSVSAPDEKTEAELKPELDGLSEEEKAVVRLLIESDKQFEELVALTGLSAGVLNGILPMLEIEGIIGKLAGNRYRYVCD